MTDDPVSELLAAAITLHELYETFLRAGFSTDQAFELVLVFYSKTLEGGSE